MAFAIGSGMSYGFYGVFSTLLVEAGVTDVSIAILPVFALSVYFGIRVAFKARVLKGIPVKHIVCMVLQGFFISNGMNYCYTQAYSNGMPVGVVSVVAFTNVIIVMVLSFFVFGYKFTVPKIAAIAMVLLGVSLVVGLYGGGMAGITTTGLMWTALIPLFYGVNIVLNSYFISKGYDSDAILFITQTGALAFMLVFMVNLGSFFSNMAQSLTTPVYWIALFGFCLIPQVLCYSFMQESLKRVEPTLFQICMALDPVTALVVGALALGQSVDVSQIIGIAVVLGAVLFINLKEGKEAQDDVPPSACDEEPRKIASSS